MSEKRGIKKSFAAFGAAIKRGFASIKRKLYDMRAGLYRATHKKPKLRRLGQQKRNDLIFYMVMLVIPVTQFSIFYLGVNINSILLSFRSYDYVTNHWSFVGFDNFRKVIEDISTQYVLIQAAKNSAILYVVSILTGMLLSLLFSYYIYKKLPLSGIFKVMLFMPSIISSIAMVVMYSYFVENAFPAIVQSVFGIRTAGLLANPETTFGTVLFYCVWSGFGPSILMYLGAMNTISDSVVEAARLEGIRPLQEFFRITIPLIYPTIVTFTVVGVVGIFTNQMNLFSFYGGGADYRLYTFGYYLYTRTQGGTRADYPFLSAMGLLMTMVALPVTLLVRYAMEKLGPKVD